MNNLYKLVAALLVLTLMFTACGDDSSSSASADDENGSEKDNGAVSTEAKSGSIEIDEAAKTMQVRIVQAIEKCVSDDNGDSYKMESQTPDTLYIAMQYKFYDDTLALTTCKTSDEHIDSIDTDNCTGFENLYVGGTMDSIAGTWTYTNCYKDGDTMLCDEDDGSTSLVKITKKSYKIVQTVSREINIGDSYFAEKLISAIAGYDHTPYYADFYAAEVVEKGDVVDVAKKNSVKITRKNSDELVFKYNDRKFTVKLVNNSAAYIYDYEVTVSSDGNSCKLVYRNYNESGMTDDVCNVKNVEGFETTYFYDEDDNKIYVVTDYIDDNVDEFNECMSYFVAGDSVGDDYVIKRSSSSKIYSSSSSSYSSSSYSSSSYRSSSSSYRSSSSQKEILLETNVDEDNQTLVFKNIREVSYCVTDEDHSSFEMSDVEMGTSDVVGYQYKISHDSLFLYECSNYKTYGFSSCGNKGDIYIGKDVEGIYGTWESTGCYKYGLSNTNSCVSKYEPVDLNISKDDITVVSRKVEVENKPVDLRKTEFMEDLIDAIFKGYYSPNAALLFLSGEYKNNFDGRDIKVKAESSSEITLAYNDHEIVTKLNKSQQNPYNVSVSVTAGGFKCEMKYVSYDKYSMNKDVCTKSNKDYFDVDAIYDADGNAFYYVVSLLMSNESEFEECMCDLREAVVPEDGDDGVVDVDIDLKPSFNGKTTSLRKEKRLSRRPNSKERTQFSTK